MLPEACGDRQWQQAFLYTASCARYNIGYSFQNVRTFIYKAGTMPRGFAGS